MNFEEPRNSLEVFESSNPEFQTVPIVDGDHPATEVPLQLHQDSSIPAVLHDAELGEDLPPRPHRRLTIEGDVETPFPVDKAHDPVRFQPFLLITCTHHVFTGVLPLPPSQEGSERFTQ